MYFFLIFYLEIKKRLLPLQSQTETNTPREVLKNGAVVQLG